MSSEKFFPSDKKLSKTPLQVSLKKFHVIKPNRSEKRFIRACRRVLNKAKGDDHQAILATARKNKIIPKPPDTTEPYNPIPNMFIPEKYRDIIPKDPIYIDDRFITPGSREWFTYMYNLEKSIREQEIQDFNERVHREVEQAFKRTRIEKQASREQAKEERK
ncbi:hypothetical protein GLOIN_2v1839388 [Rhizophagus irregularis DAOM 181602=DAOM 197198]|uniref:Uncharacterized protein n=2 Tax=Rhizophagus irregularis TaxID=588596 RepID=A0A2P4Q9H4_RHIID|nr:hypothetical protein GLOIN_2v1839388 [Rhizophagus irregularis DAOM 181602=DAOM 197198]POG74276.1 hypothetical protein GLOIN_2v1839388 [Rhizophagus irregularis DAOM 181602=DAOM 197198]|eukprot:XP_025181142.1 hypothetical protein GLOIN_2v1839388 [Rhizophagus irregularis DAOM 181602=DAOM 197198]